MDLLNAMMGVSNDAHMLVQVLLTVVQVQVVQMVAQTPQMQFHHY